MIKIEVNTDDTLIVADGIFSNAVSDGVKHRAVKFLFPPKWDGYEKTAVFLADGIEPINILLNQDNTLCIGNDECYIPFEVLKGDSFEVSVFGVMGDSLATTTRVKINVKESGYTLGDMPGEPTQSEYQQIIDIVTKTQEIAQSVRDDADNGAFDGKQGIDGKDAITDLVYNPESENAQSGKAVSQAMDQAVTSERVRDSIEGTTFIFDGGNAIDNQIIDSDMSDTSGNAVQNKVVKKYVDTEILNAQNKTKQEIFPIGSIWTGSSNINPSTLFGGEWELFDKEFASANGSLDNNNDIISYNGTQSNGLFFVRVGHTLRIRMKLITGVEIDDNGAELIKIADIKTLGINAFAYNYYDVIATSDSGNALLIVSFNADGLISVGDVIEKFPTDSKHILDAGKTIYFDMTIPIRTQDMLDEVCDKFYWRRIG